MTTIDMTKLPQKESWGFIYSAYGSMLAVVPLFLSFLPLAWPYKIAVFYGAFLAISYGSLLNPKGRRALTKLKTRIAR